LIDDIRKATDEELSNLEPLKELLSARYTIHPNSLINPYHIDVIRSPLTRSIGAGFADVHDEVKAAFANRIPVTDGEFIPDSVIGLVDSLIRLDRDMCKGCCR